MFKLQPSKSAQIQATISDVGSRFRLVGAFYVMIIQMKEETAITVCQ